MADEPTPQPTQDFPYRFSGVNPATNEMGTFLFHSDRKLTPEEQARKHDELFQKPAPVMPEGAGTEGGSPALNAAKAALPVVGGIALSAALPELAPGAGLLATGARAGLAAGGQMLGQAGGTLAVEGRLPSAQELAPQAAMAGGTQMLVDAAGKLLLSGAQKSEIASALMKETRFTARTGAADTTIVGEFVKDVLPSANRRLNQLKNAKYNAVRAAGSSLPPITIPNDITNIARSALDEMGPAGASLATPQEAKARIVLSKIVDRGTPRTINGRAVPPKPIRFNDLTKWVRQLNEVLPSYQGRFNTGSFSTGSLSHVRDRIDQTMMRMAAGTPTEAPLKEAKRFFAQEVAPFREGFDAILTDSVGPTDVVNTLVRAGRPDRLNAIFRQVSPETRNVISTAWFADTLQNAIDPQTGVLSAKKLLHDWNAIGVKAQSTLAQGKHEAVTSIFDKIGYISRVEGGISATAKYAPAATSGAATLGALNDFLNGNNTRGMEKLLVAGAAPLVLPKLLASKRMIGILQGSLDAPQGTKIAIRFGRLIAQSLREAATPAVTAGVSGLTGGPEMSGPGIGSAANEAQQLRTPTQMLNTPNFVKDYLMRAAVVPTNQQVGPFTVADKAAVKLLKAAKHRPDLWPIVKAAYDQAERTSVHTTTKALGGEVAGTYSPRNGVRVDVGSAVPTDIPLTMAHELMHVLNRTAGVPNTLDEALARFATERNQEQLRKILPHQEDRQLVREYLVKLVGRKRLFRRAP